MSEEKKSVIRYTKEEMIKLHDSPLVQKPEKMPSLLSWFGEDQDSPATKSILNGSIMIRTTSTDKNIVLGPTKTNFASSTYGGLKKLDDNNSTTSATSKLQQTTSARHHRQLEDRSTTLKDYSRTSRGLIYTGDKGSSYSHRTSSDMNKSLSDRKYMGSSPPHGNYSNNNNMNKNRFNNGTERLNNGMAGGKQMNYNNRANNRHHNNHMLGHNTNHHNMGMDRDSDRSERVPEWMDYTPDIDKSPLEASKEAKVDEEDAKAKFANDLEAWKSNMKKRDGFNDGTISTATTTRNTITADKAATTSKPSDTKSVEESLATLAFDSPSVVTPSTDALSFFEDSLLIEPPPIRRDQKSGSRFAKFFAKKEEPTSDVTTAVVEAPDQSLAQRMNQLKQPPSVGVGDQQPRSITLNDLFKAGSPMANLAATEIQSKPESPLSPPIVSDMLEKSQEHPVRVFSEEDILKSLGANKASAAEQKDPVVKSPNQKNNEDAIGFNRVLQILSQPKPSLSSQQQQEETEKATYQQKSNSNKGSPRSISSPQAKPSVSTSSSTSASVASKFGNNLPTSVLRQMSARSSEGRSPSLHSSKTNTPHLSEMRYSPSAKHQQQYTQQQQQQQPQQPQPQQQQQQQQLQQQQPMLPHQHHLPNGGIPLPPQYFPYHHPHHPQQQQPYSPGQHHPSRIMSFEQMMHFSGAGNNGDMSRGMPPPPPHHPPTGAPPPPPGSHHGPHPPHLSADQQQRFLPPHMMMGPPPPPHHPHMLPPGGQRPLLTPPIATFNQPLPPQLQGRFPPPHQLPQQQQQQQQQNDMMLPMPPHALPNGLPPQMFGKNQ
ncbi:hypothetical protein BDF20DRAFT_331357 [Mycotypha africana]|uniref:uncharacterized protein n=1 Tax=Mycotypha africana TaxID=64632 RepID=UPI00230108A0|nr:uncharacterized protein BDF20DRAFT_331357 [Mycotypha africana]KAI8988421.1 hypothetical protein BDF20DRAFT_331357 [Mycotypha africana]